jgi:hypothetical protein
MSEVKLNENGVNANIKAHILPEDQMRKLGFTDFCNERWYFCKMIKFPNEKRYRNFEISFGVSITKDNPDDLRIDVLDNDFCQPFDYQYMLKRNDRHEISLIVREQVEEWMKYLQKEGVLKGHIYGEYI